MANMLPTLSSSGWVADIGEKADRLMSYYFVSDASQTNLYLGHITSLPLQIQRFSGNELELERIVSGELTAYFERYFDGAEVEVSTARPAPGDPNRLNITIDAIVVQDGKRYSLGRLINTVNSKIVDIVDTNNFKGSTT